MRRGRTPRSFLWLLTRNLLVSLVLFAYATLVSGIGTLVEMDDPQAGWIFLTESP